MARSARFGFGITSHRARKKTVNFPVFVLLRRPTYGASNVSKSFG